MDERKSMKTKTVTLSEPLIVGGKELAEVVVRRSTVGDEEDAMQQAIGLKQGNNPVTVELCLMSRVTRLPYDAIRSMTGPEYQKLKTALNALNGPVEDVNPTDGTEANA